MVDGEARAITAAGTGGMWRRIERIGQGRHRVVMVYQPRRLAPSLLAGAAGLAGLLGLLILPRRTGYDYVTDDKPPS